MAASVKKTLNTISTAESKWSPINLVPLPTYLAIRKFEGWVEGRQFTVCTDRRPLIGAMNRLTDRQTAKTPGLHLLIHDRPQTQVRQKQGGGGLSVPAVCKSHTCQPTHQPRAAGQQPTKGPRSPPLQNCTIRADTRRRAIWPLHIPCDTSTKHNRPMVSTDLCRPIFKQMHGLCHTGPKSTTLIDSINSAVSHWAYAQCQRPTLALAQQN